MALKENGSQMEQNTTTFSFIRRNYQALNSPQLNTLLGRLDQQFLGYKGMIRGNLTYEVSSGQEQKIEYNYIKVFQDKGIIPGSLLK